MNTSRFRGIRRGPSRY